MPIITSLLDTDFYKFTMANFIYYRFPITEVEYTFVCRNNIDLTPIADMISEQIKSLCELKLTDDEIEFLRKQEVFGDSYLDYLKDFKLDFGNVYISTKNGFSLKIKGDWVETILFETPILAIISNLSVLDKPHLGWLGFFDKLDFKIRQASEHELKFADFGTRRRFSKQLQSDIIDKIKSHPKNNNFLGTSNVMFAYQYNLKPIGTMAHEILATAQVLAPTLRESQQWLLEQWLDEYDGKLGIALTDIITMDAFLRDFNYALASAYQGCRHDSGDPYIWGNKLIKHYKQLDIDPMTKTAVFSDGLTFDSMVEINKYFKDRINVVFGIGTNLTNNVGIEPANIVIKLTKVNGQPVAKLSDSPGKTICDDQDYIKLLKRTFDVA